MNRFLILLFAVAILSSCNKNNDPKPDSSGMFVKFFGGAFDDNGFSVINSNDGGYYIAGSTVMSGRQDTSIYVAKLDGNGNKEWDKIYDFGDNYNEVSRDLILNTAGQLVVVGYKGNSALGSNILVITINNNNPDNFTFKVLGDITVNEKATAIVQDVDGFYIIMGNSYSSTTLNDMFFKKTDLTTTQWHRVIGSFDQDDYFGELKKAKNGNLVWCGTTNTPKGTNMVLTFADSYGNLLYNRMYNANDYEDQFGYGLALLSDDSFVIAGSREKKSGTGRNIFIVKTDDRGNVSSAGNDTLTLSPGDSQEAYSIVAVNDNEYVITGYINSSKGDKDIYVAKVDSKGTILQSNSFGSEGNDIGMKVIKGADNGFLIIGTIYASNNKMIGVYKLNQDLSLTK